VCPQELERENRNLNMERDTTKLWSLTEAMNDEWYSGQKITIEDDEKTLIGRTADNSFAKAYAQESSITIPRHKTQRKRKETKLNDVMTNDITMAELKKSINQLKKKKSPGPDHVTNEML
jgi:small-conductance mechanosensitive channel